MDNLKMNDSKIIDTLVLQGSRTYDITCYHIQMSDGHEYIVSTGILVGCDAGGVSSTIIHAAGCKKCLENLKNKN